MKRIHAIIEGRVQGIFFRANTRKQANKLDVKGWVKNLPDGGVEVVAEGKELAIKKFIEFLQKGPFGAKVTKFDVKEEKCTGEFEFFEIEY